MKTLQELKAIGAFYAPEPVQKQIKFVLAGQEYEATIWVKKISLGERDRMAAMSASDDRSSSALIISEVVTLGDDGSEKLSLDDAYRLAPQLADAMLIAAREVNGGAERKN